MTTESQQAALKPVGYVCANNGSGGLQVCEKDAPGAMPIYASDIERPAPVDHAALKEAVARAIAREASQEKPEGWVTLGVGDGSGQLFVYGPYEAIKECQRKLLRTPAPVDHAARARLSADAEWLRHLGNDLYAKGHLDRHEAEEIGRVADRHLRAHPAGGVSEERVQAAAKAISLSMGHDISDMDLSGNYAPKSHIGLCMKYAQAALRAASIGAGVVRFPRCTGPTHGGMIDLASPVALAVARVLSNLGANLLVHTVTEDILLAIEAAAPSHDKGQ